MAQNILLAASALMTAGLLAACRTPAVQYVDGEPRMIEVNHPPAGIEYDPATGVAYFRQGGIWHQLRVDVSSEPLRVERQAGLDLYLSDLRAKATVWRFNPITRRYDRKIDTPSKANYTLVFFERPEESGVLQVQHSFGGGVGGSTRIPGRNSSDIEFEVTPPSTGELKGPDGEIELTVKASAYIDFPRWTQSSELRMAVASVERSIAATLLRDGEVSLAAAN